MTDNKPTQTPCPEFDIWWRQQYDPSGMASMNIPSYRDTFIAGMNTRASTPAIEDKRLEHYKRENAALRAEIEIYKSAHKDELQ